MSILIITFLLVLALAWLIYVVPRDVWRELFPWLFVPPLAQHKPPRIRRRARPTPPPTL